LYLFFPDIAQYHEEFEGKDFHLAGPEEYTMKEIYEYVLDVADVKHKTFIDIPVPLASLIGKITKNRINPRWTDDFVHQLTEDNILQPAAENDQFCTFADLNIEPVSLDKISFDYLHRFRYGGHFRKVAGYY
jgi:hypothetical protein